MIVSQLVRYQQSQFFECLGAIWENVLQGHLDKEGRATHTANREAQITQGESVTICSALEPWLHCAAVML